VTAPLPRGVVRLTTVDDKPLLAPAAAIVATPVNKDWSRYRVGGESIVDAFDAHPDSDGWQVKETVDEIQAALVAALGAQDGDDDRTVVYMSGFASKADEIADLKLQLANMTAAAEVAARARDGINAAVSAIVSAARKEEREALESRLSLAEKVVEAAEDSRRKRKEYDRAVLDDQFMREAEFQYMMEADSALDAALAAYRSAK